MEKYSKSFFDRTINIRASLLLLMTKLKTETELKQVEEALQELSALSPKLVHCTYCSCVDRSRMYRDKEDNDMCYDCDLPIVYESNNESRYREIRG